MDEDNFPDQCHPLIKSKKKKVEEKEKGTRQDNEVVVP